MRVALSLADVIVDTTEMLHAGVVCRMQDLAESAPEALQKTLCEADEIALSRGNFLNEDLINGLKEIQDTEYHILCDPSEESLAYTVSDILRDTYGLNISDVFANHLEDMEDYLRDVDIHMVVTNNIRLLSACMDYQEVICYGMHDVRIPIVFTTDVQQVLTAIKNYKNSES